jgi:branched-subunit amino acid transport protein AzlD
MVDTEHLILFIVVMTAATFITRLLPFVIFQKQSKHPLMSYIAKYAPPMIMSILVLYVLQGVDFTNISSLKTLAAIATTVGVHLWRGNSLMSIFAGTSLYMFLLQS